MNQRRALAPIEINRSYGQELSSFQRGQISAYKAVGLSNSKIADKLNCGKTTVFNNLVQNPLRKDGNSQKRSGRPQSLNRIDKRNILRIIRTNPKITYQALKFTIEINVHINTLSRMFKNENIKNLIIKERSLLIAEVVVKRLT